MKKAQKAAVKVAVAAVVLGILGWLFVRTIRNAGSEPYSVDASMLSGWTVAVAEPSSPAVVVLQPTSQIAAELFRQIFQRNMQSIVSPSQPAIPLVLRTEYADSLQGVHGVQDLVRIAKEAGVENARFQPVCLARQRESTPGRTGELYFVVLDAPLFYEARQRLVPLQPEHGGTLPFEPFALRPVLAIASTDQDFGRWWPLNVDEQADCQAPITVRSQS